MNKTPSILVNSGFPVDQNGALTELIMPNVVTTLNTPTKITFNGTALAIFPFKAYEFVAPNITALAFDYKTDGDVPPFDTARGTLQKLALANCVTLSSITGARGSSDKTGLFSRFAHLTELNAPNLESIYSEGGYGISGGDGCFNNCTSLTTLNLPKLVSITCYEGGGGGYGSGCFSNCTGLTTLNLPELTTITYSGSGNGVFSGCTGLTSVTLPKLTNLGGYTFKYCTSLSSVTFGSDNNPVSTIGSNAFNNCTQAGLTITIYTQGGAALSGEPWGATNADIEYEEA